MTLDYVLDSYKKKNGLQSIRLRVIVDRKPQYIASGHFVKNNQWNTKKAKVYNHPLENQINSKLTLLYNDFHDFALKQNDTSSKNLVRNWKSKIERNKLSFLEYYKERTDLKRAKGDSSTARTNYNYIRKLKHFSPDISYSDLNIDFIRRFEKWMIDKGNKPNTIAVNMGNLKAVINDCIKDGYMDDNPFKLYKIVRVNAKKEYLPYKQIQNIEKITIKPRRKVQILARDMILYSFYAAGMRFRDVCFLKWSNIEGESMIYTMSKSRKRSGSQRVIPLTPPLKRILEKYKGRNKTYVFPVLQRVDVNDLDNLEIVLTKINGSINSGWKRFCEDNNIKSTSFHSSKHSFADYAVQSGIDLLTISKLLGHTKLDTTQEYLKDFYNKQQNEALNKMFG